MVKESSCHQQPQSLYQLHHLGVIYHAHIQHTIVWHSIRSLSVAWTRTYAHGHHLAVDNVAVYLQFHLIFHTVEQHHKHRYNKRQRVRTKQAACLSAQVHYVGSQSDVYAVQKVAMTLCSLLVGIAYAAQVNLAYTALYKPVDGLLYVVAVKVPEFGKVVQHAVRYHSQRYLVAYRFLFHHQAVHSVVQSRVAAYYHNGLVAILNHHFHQSFHTFGRLALHKVI